MSTCYPCTYYTTAFPYHVNQRLFITFVCSASICILVVSLASRNIDHAFTAIQHGYCRKSDHDLVKTISPRSSFDDPSFPRKAADSSPRISRGSAHPTVPPSIGRYQFGRFLIERLSFPIKIIRAQSSLPRKTFFCRTNPGIGWFTASNQWVSSRGSRESSTDIFRSIR